MAGLRNPDRYIKVYAQYLDRDQEGECIFSTPPHYVQGPTVCTLITQYGIGRPVEENNIAKKIIENSRSKQLVERLSEDSLERRIHIFNLAMTRMAALMRSSARHHIKTIVIPVGIARAGMVDKVWLTKYLPIIYDFSLKMKKLSKEVIITMSRSLLNILDDEIKGDTNCDIDNNVVLYYKTSLVDLPVVESEKNTNVVNLPAMQSYSQVVKKIKEM